MCVGLVGTLSHVSAGARYYGLKAAHEKAAATQQLYEYYSQLLDQTSENNNQVKPDVRSREDPLQITQLEEEAAPIEKKSSSGTQQLYEISSANKEAARESDRRPERVDDDEISEQILDSDPAADAAEAAEHAPLQTETLAENEVAALKPHLALKSELAQIDQDEDEKELRTHRASIETLKGMIANTKRQIKQHSHKLMIKEIAKEVVQQMLKQQSVTSSSQTEKLAQIPSSDDSVEDQIQKLNQEIATVSSLSDTDVARHLAGEELKPKAHTDELAAETENMSVDDEIKKLHNEIATVSSLSATDVAEHIQMLSESDPWHPKDQGSEDKNTKKTADGAQFQVLDAQDPWHPKDQGSEDKNTKKTADGAQFQVLDAQDPWHPKDQGSEDKNTKKTADGAQFQVLDEESAEEYITKGESSVDHNAHSPELPMLASKPSSARAQALDDEETSKVVTQELDMLRAQPTARSEEELEARAAQNIVRTVEHEMLQAPIHAPVLPQLASTNTSVVVAPAPVSTHWAKTNISIEVGPPPAPVAPRTLIVHQQTAYPEDVLAKKVAALLSPTIGDRLTKQLMAKVATALTNDEAKVEKTITSAAAQAAKEAVASAKAKALHAAQKTVTTVHHTPESSVVTTVKGPADMVPDGTIAKARSEPGAPIEVLAQPVHIEDSPSSLLKQIESIAVEKHQVDRELAQKETTMLSSGGIKSIAAKLKS
jgi:hypothetical protein